MADLALTFVNLYEQVERYLGTYNSGSASAAAVTDAKFIVNRAYAKFVSYYDWYFLYQKRTLETVDGDYVYELPSDFSYLTNNYLYFDTDDGYPPVCQRSMGQIIDFRNDSNYESYPLYFALQAGDYHKETGQAWDIVMYPTPDTKYYLTYYSKINPEKLTADGDIPIGGADMSECLLELCLAYAEAYKDERRAVFTEKVNEVLLPAKRIDNKRRPNKLGTLNVQHPMLVDIDRVHNGSVLVSSS